MVTRRDVGVAVQKIRLWRLMASLVRCDRARADWRYHEQPRLGFVRRLDMTHEYRATVEWKRQGVAFVDNKYSRGHVWRFDGGVEVLASSACGRSGRSARGSDFELPYVILSRFCSET